MPATWREESGVTHRWWNRASVSQWLVSWPTAFRLGLLRKLPEWSPLDAG